MTTFEKYEQGNISALSRIISHVENREKGYETLLSQLYLRPRKAIRIGLTGPPGAGKSTLVDCISRRLLQRADSVGVIAVDPSSPFTGGALLGDRVRSREESQAEGAPMRYFRSMATRGSRGGLSGATDNVALVMDAFGFDYVLIETVGVGQVELDIVDNCDLVVVILVPESGDSVQTLKAGLSEIADIFVVNKSDREGADRVVADLTTTLSLRQNSVAEKSGAQKSGAEVNVPIVATDAVHEKNVDLLLEEIDSTLRAKQDNESFKSARRRQMREKIKRILQQRFISETADRLAGTDIIESSVDEILLGGSDPYTVADKLYNQMVSE